MQFHEYVNIKQRLLRDAAPEAKQRFKSFDSSRFRGTVVKSVMEGCDEGKPYAYQAEAEGIWAAHERPFYNVWPIGVGLARNVQLAVPCSSIRLPCEFSTETLGGGTISTTPLLFRFAKGHEPYGM